MGSVTEVLRTSILLFLIALAFIIAYQMLTGRINTHRLLIAKGQGTADPSTRRRTSGLSPSRIQMLIVTTGIAIYLISEVLKDPTQFPEIPSGLLLLIAGSEAIYLALKANNLIVRRKSPNK